MLLASIIMHAAQPIRKERSAASIYHLLQGKRSAQTLQDAHMYGLTHLFGIYPKLSRQLFDQVAADVMNGAGQSEDQDIPYFRGMTYQTQTESFLYRLLLLIQLLSNHVREEKQYIPVTDNPAVKHWIKLWYRQEHHRLDEWRNAIYRELYELLGKLPPLQAELFVDRLTGYQRIGLTPGQLAGKYNIHETDVLLYQTSTVHHLLLHGETKAAVFPYLAALTNKPEHKTRTITSTARKTRTMLERGLTLDQIAAVRGLTENTIKDHIVEMAWLDGEELSRRFLSDNDASIILECAARAGTKKLKQIHALLDGKYNYFQIRLALALRSGQEVEA
ncbi:helix-turn-helix domain-containing protein [Terribacillus sp. 179-K 1B1 HS]|uniref:helix-turn-helix domain-containing protein n=1 Tax=Terribacillus sp. 179-K 1B1 HS TaxID=3142388 RepID=UPI00399F4499